MGFKLQHFLLKIIILNNTPSVQENKPCGNKIMSNYKNPQNSRGKIFKLARHVSKQNLDAEGM